jgi:dihydroorotase
MYSSHAGIELYAEVFEAANALDKLEAFASFHGPDFYGLPRNQDQITMERSPWQIPEELPMAETTVVPLDAGQLLQWKFVG